MLEFFCVFVVFYVFLAIFVCACCIHNLLTDFGRQKEDGINVVASQGSVLHKEVR